MELIKLEGLDLLKAYVKKELETYPLILIKDETDYKDAKKQRASLNGLVKKVNDERISLGKELKTKVDSIIGLVPIDLADKEIKAFEDKLNKARKEDIEVLFFTLDFPSEVALDKIYTDKWLNLTCDFESELKTWREKITRDLEICSMLGKDFTKYYFQFLDISKTKQYIESLNVKEEVEEQLELPFENSSKTRTITFDATDEEYEKVLFLIESFKNELYSL